MVIAHRDTHSIALWGLFVCTGNKYHSLRLKKNSFMRKTLDVSTILSAPKTVCHRKYDIYPTDKTF